MAQMIDAKNVIHLANITSLTSLPKLSNAALDSLSFDTITGRLQALLIPLTWAFQ